MCITELMPRNCVLTSRFCYPLYPHQRLTHTFLLYDTDSLGTVPEGGPNISLYRCDRNII